MKYSIFRMTVTVTLCCILSACNSVDEIQTASLPSGDIAYLSNKSGVTELWLTDVQTRTSRQITTSSCVDSSQTHGSFRPGVQFYSWSPNGDKVAYAIACSYYDEAKMFVLNVATGKTVAFGEGDRYSSYPSWSPDGSRLIFGRGFVGFSPFDTYGIYLFDLNGVGDSQTDKTEQIVFGENCVDGCLYPTWSPNGRYITYLGPHVPTAISRRSFVSIIDASQYLTGVQSIAPLISPLGIHDVASHGLAWSPNSQFLAIATVHDYTGAYLTVIYINDPSKSLLLLKESSATHPSLFGPGFYTPVFSPDATDLYFVARPLKSVNEDIMPDPFRRFGVIFRIQVPSAGSNNAKDGVKAITSDEQLAGFPSLSYDGKWLTYTVVTGQSAEIWLETSDGQFRQKVIGDGYTNTQSSWKPLQN